MSEEVKPTNDKQVKQIDETLDDLDLEDVSSEDDSPVKLQDVIERMMNKIKDNPEELQNLNQLSQKIPIEEID